MTQPLQNIYIGLLFGEKKYNEGLNDIINIINMRFPNNALIIEKYVTDGSVQSITTSLDNFISLYPNGNRILISATTFTLNVINNYLKTNNITIPSFSLSATSPVVKTFTNVLTYAPFDQISVMNNFMILTEYNLDTIKILYEPDTNNDIFFQSYIELVIKQAGLLNIPISIEILNADKKYSIDNKSLIIILSTTESLKNKYINDDFISSIPIECCISLTDLNDDCGDIFGSIPSFVVLPFVVDYTTTTQLVYNEITNKKNIFYGVYTFFDILVTLLKLSTTELELTISNYLSINPFIEFPSAYGYGLFDVEINGSRFGSYELVFTKDVIIDKDIEIYNEFNNGGIGRLPESQSIFKSMGIVPFFTTQIFNCNQDYFKFYSRDGSLVLTRFDKSVTTYNSNSIIISENLACQFSISFTEDGFFSSLINLPSLNQPNPTVNPTMSKKVIIKYVE